MNTKKAVLFITSLALFSFGLSACSSIPKTPPQTVEIISEPTGIVHQATATIPQATLTSTTTPPTATKTPAATREQLPPPLSETGPQQVGKRYYEFQDPSRDDREVAISVWYPAVLTDEQARKVIQDAPPDLSGAPYPVILSSAKTAGIFGPHMVSHGFIAVGIRNIDTYNPWDQNLIDQPLDILYALDQVGTQPLDGLGWVIDVDRAGAMGYSFGGFNSLALSGARIDPDFFLEKCRRALMADPPISDFWLSNYCSIAETWDDFEDHAGRAITMSEDGMWQPMTDPRILAVMPMAPDGAWIFGERGLAAVDRPTMILVGTDDWYEGLSIYDMESVYIYEHLGMPDRFLISFIGRDHYMVFVPTSVGQMKHFATAFFGYYLQGREDYTEYFSEDFVSQYDDLNWGVYKE